jgi:hypothetical protein
MWPVERPTFDAGDTFQICVSRVRDWAFRRRLIGVRHEIEVASADYETRAEAGELHLIRTNDTVGGSVTSTEMVNLYDRRMARKNGPARSIYNEIRMLPEGDRCPFCDQRNVSTLDHILPKGHYPALAVAPLNLVGACMECNKLKLDVCPDTARDTFLHPYFDDISADNWLTADVIEQCPCAVVFDVNPPGSWGRILTARMRHQFELLKLAELYSREAAREISDIRYNLQRHFDAGGRDAVRQELRRQWQSRRANRLNSWQTATYKALSDSGWFCDEGFGC